MRLAHYTSIESLELILKNENFRFTRLDYLDDFYEVGIYNSFATKFFFVSSWVNSDKESIPQWTMYGNCKKGVIIKLDSDFFDIPDSKLYKIEEGGKNVKISIIGNLYKNIPQPVKYLVFDELKLKAEEIHKINDFKGIDIKFGFGCFKTNDWEFQKESRYIVQIVKHKGESHNSIEDFIYNGRHIDIPLKKGFKENLEIIVGPLCDDAQRGKVEDLKNLHGITNVKDSVFKDILIK